MPLPSNPYFRDEIIIDQSVEDLCNSDAVSGPVFLLGRVVRLAQDLRLTRHAVVIVADLFDGGGHVIHAAGDSAPVVDLDGADGVAVPMSEMYTADGRPRRSGSSGTGGGAGGSGASGISVTVYSRRTSGVQIVANGGNGAPGGRGGNGTGGGDGAVLPDRTEQRDLTPQDPFDSEFEEIFIPGETIDGTPGGDGAYGGNGGSGGNGGAVAVTSVTDDSPPVVSATRGAAAPGGAGGSAGRDGALSPSAAVPGGDGAWGQPGADGAVSVTTVTEADFIAGLRAVLGSSGEEWANYWAPFRIARGDYLYHRYDAGDPNRADDLGLASVEFARGLELQPDNATALRLQAQLVGEPRADARTGDVVWAGGGLNALGFSPNHDILPSFDTYISAFQGFSGLTAQFLFAGVDHILDSGTTAGLASLVDLHQRSASASRDAFLDDVEMATTEQKIATEDVDFLQKQLDQAAADLEAAMAEMKESSFSFGDIVGTVAQVASAVVGVIAAIPTAGASLVALVPAMVSLADTVLDNAAPIAQAILAGTEADTKAVKDAYKKVEKDAAAVVAAGKSIVNFVSVIQRLTASSTPDNAKQVALVRRGAELAHQMLIARDRITLAQQRKDAAQARADAAAGLTAQAEGLSDQLTADAESVRRVGLLAITVAQASAEALLGMAFRAARSVEIYTLQPQAQNLRLDAGILSPDTWRDYYEHRMSDVELATALTASWADMLAPINIQRDYLAYFERAHDQDVLTRIFRPGDREFDQLRERGRFDFRVDAESIPAGRADAKTRSVRLALVGASHPTGAISCEVRHGGAYEQRRENGDIDVQLLQPRVSIRRAVTVPLDPDEDATVDQPLTAPLSLAFWGRGVGGDWGISLADTADNSHADLTSLTEIQVEIRYQFLR